MEKDKLERLKELAIYIDKKLKYYDLPLTMENIRRVFDLVYRKIPEERIIKAVYKIIYEVRKSEGRL